MTGPIRLAASDEEVLLHVRGFAVLRATYEAEGYYDPRRRVSYVPTGVSTPGL